MTEKQAIKKAINFLFGLTKENEYNFHSVKEGLADKYTDFDKYMKSHGYTIHMNHDIEKPYTYRIQVHIYENYPRENILTEFYTIDEIREYNRNKDIENIIK